MRSRAGFTVIELVIVLMLAGLVAGVSVPRIGQALAQNRMQRAAAVVATDMQLAHSLAARQSRPVVLSVDGANRIMRIADVQAPNTVYNARHLGSSEFGVTQLTSNRASIMVYPTGLANNGIEVTLRAAGSTRIVSMSRAGQVRVR
jgi:type II secretion system protein H